ncbi:MAG: NTP transferase domain-containing protein [Muribaculaceae bacterium]|nr:NTP transferase domain-containing protein [Muribaculaceae bacterium]
MGIDNIYKDRKELFDKHVVPSDTSVRDAMRMLNRLSGNSMTLFVIDKGGMVKGSVTDGDIRRALIGNKELSDSVTEVMNPEFLYAVEGEDLTLKLAEGRRRHIELMPVLEHGILKDFIDLRVTKAQLPLEAVLMAGGRGERLRPLTDNMPKPLLPVDGKPIIDYNIEELEACGIKKIHVTVNYMADMIERHFAERKGSAGIDCVREPRHLGTFGSLAYLKNVETENIIVMNSDLLSNIDFEGMFVHHRNVKADFTIAAVPYSVSVPFAIMRMSRNRVSSLEEKPTFNYFANGGVYIMKSELIGRIPKGDYLDAPDFIMSLIHDNFHVSAYHIDGSWIDIGSPDDYRLANDLMARRR